MTPRSETYKHLEDPYRMWGLTIGQWIGAIVLGGGAVAFGLYWSPLPAGPTISVTLFVAGLPVALAYAVNAFDVAISETLWCVLRWARGVKHFLPGGGVPSSGYVVTRVVDRPVMPVRTGDGHGLEGAWDE